MSAKIKIELKCSHCDKRSAVPASGLFPRHCAVHGTGYYGRRIERGRDCAGSGIDATARVVAEAEQRAKNCAQRVLEIGAGIERLRARMVEESARVDAYLALLAKIDLRGAK